MTENGSTTTLHGLFNCAVKKYPDNVAVEFYNEDGTKSELMYKQISQLANHVCSAISNHISVGSYVDARNASHIELSELGVSKGKNCKKLSGCIIGLYTTHCVFLPSLLIGIMSKGCHFMPLNPHFPDNVNIELVLQTKMRHLLIDKTATNFINALSLLFTHLETIQFELPGFGSVMHLCVLKDSSHQILQQSYYCDLAYTLSTSGTTGTPKLVNVPHKCILPNILHLRQIYKVTSTDKVVMCSPLTFDPSIVEMFVALSSGATLVLIHESFKTKPSEMLNILFNRSKITVMQATPSLIKQCKTEDLRNTMFSETSSLRILAMGGEACPLCQTIRSWLHPDLLKTTGSNSSKFRFINFYGITEVSSWATWYEIPDEQILEGSDEAIPIGHPLMETVLDIVDESGEILCQISAIDCDLNYTLPSSISGNVKVSFSSKPTVENESIFVSGYLRIGGENRVCYLESDECDTDMSFADNKIVMRNTGDIVSTKIDCIISVQPCGHNAPLTSEPEMKRLSITYEGRTDNQIKRKGKRMNTVYVKQKLESLNLVSAAYVTCVGFNRKDGTYVKRSSNVTSSTTSSVEIRLVAFIVLCEQAMATSSTEVLVALSKVIAAHCIPDEIVFVSNIPITTHCKVNEASLIEILVNQSKNIQLNQDLDLKLTLQKCWTEALLYAQNQEHVECNKAHKNFKEQNFVKRGGNSFAAVKLVSLLQRELENILTPEIPDLLQVILEGTYRNVLDKINAIIFENNKHSSKEPVISIIKSTKCEINVNRKRSKEDDLIENPIKVRHVLTNKKPHSIVSFTRSGQNYFHGVNAVENIEKPIDTVLEIPYSDHAQSNFKLEEVWGFNTGKCIDASPLVIVPQEGTSDGRVVIGSHSFLLACVNLSSGNVIWEVKLGGRIESSSCLTPCGEYVVVGCYDKAVYALDATNGKVEWKFATGGEVKSSACPGPPMTSIVFIGSHDGCLYCLDIEKKIVVWKYHGGKAIFSSPCFLKSKQKGNNDGCVFACTLSGKVFCLSSNEGNLRWSTELNMPVFSSPRVSSVGLCVGCVDNKIYMLSLDEGDIIWTYTTNQPIFSSPTFYTLHQNEVCDQEHVVLIGSHDGQTYCLDALNGQLIWSYSDSKESLSPIYSSPCATEFVHHNVVAVTATTDGVVSVLNLRNGRRITYTQLPGHVFSSPVFIHRTSGVVMTGDSSRSTVGDILIGCRNDNLYCLRLSVTS